MPRAWLCGEFSSITNTPYTYGRQLHPAVSTHQYDVAAGWLRDHLARHLETFPNSNNVTSIVPTVLPVGQSAQQNFRPFPDFGSGASYATTNGNSWYHSLQTKVEKQFANGLNFLATYTYSKTETDAVDLLNGGSRQGFRAPDVPGARDPL